MLTMLEFTPIETRRSAHGPAWSLTIHCGIAGLLSMAGSSPAVRRVLQNSTNAVPLTAPYLAASRSAGGGGGGDRTPLPASKGKLPKIAPRQFTPPEAVIHNANPKLAMEPTLILSAEVSLPAADLTELGNPLQGLVPARTALVRALGSASVRAWA